MYVSILATQFCLTLRTAITQLGARLLTELVLQCHNKSNFAGVGQEPGADGERDEEGPARPDAAALRGRQPRRGAARRDVRRLPRPQPGRRRPEEARPLCRSLEGPRPTQVGPQFREPKDCYLSLLFRHELEIGFALSYTATTGIIKL